MSTFKSDSEGRRTLHSNYGYDVVVAAREGKDGLEVGLSIQIPDQGELFVGLNPQEAKLVGESLIAVAEEVESSHG